MSGSYDKTVKVWDLKTGKCKLTLRGHTAAVLCVQFDEQKIVSGSYDKKIKVNCVRASYKVGLSYVWVPRISKLVLNSWTTYTDRSDLL